MHDVSYTRKCIETGFLCVLCDLRDERLPHQ
jgi:hypothetical protein